MQPRPTTARLEALRRIYRDHQPLVRAVVIGRGVADAAVDDVVHDAFLAIHRRLDERPEAVPVRQWVASVARNVAFSHRRSAARRQLRLGQLRVTDTSDPPTAELLDARRAWQVVSEFLEQVPAAQREVFVLCQVQGLAASEVASMLGCSANTVGSRLRLARAKFARHFPDADGLGDHAALLRRAARGSAPTPSQKRRSMALLLARARLAETSMVSVIVPAVAWAGVGGLVTALVIGLGWQLFDPTAAGTSDDVAALTSKPAPRLHDRSLASKDSAPAPASISKPVATPLVEPPTLRPGPTRPTVPAVRTRVSTPRPATAAPAAAHSTDDLAEQARRLHAVRRSIDAGHTAAATQGLRDHARAYPDSPLAPERIRLEIALRCAQGQIAAAKALAQNVEGIQPPDPVCPE